MEIKSFKELIGKIVEKDNKAEYVDDEFVVVCCDFVYKEDCCEFKKIWFNADGSVEISQMDMRDGGRELYFTEGINFEKMSWDRMYKLYLTLKEGE